MGEGGGAHTYVGPTITLFIGDSSLSLGAHWLPGAETGTWAGKESVINVCGFGDADGGCLVDTSGSGLSWRWSLGSSESKQAPQETLCQGHPKRKPSPHFQSVFEKPGGFVCPKMSS